MHPLPRFLLRSAPFTRGALLVLLLALTLVTTGCDDDDDGLVDPPTDPSIAELAADSDALNTLTAALEAAGLDATLGDESATYTVFAPADAAFDAYDVDFLVGNTDLLGEVLGFHVVQGAAAFSGDLNDGDTFTTVQGDVLEVAIRDGDVFVEGAQVTTADVTASNGVAHIVDDHRQARARRSGPGRRTILARRSPATAGRGADWSRAWP